MTDYKHIASEWLADKGLTSLEFDGDLNDEIEKDLTKLLCQVHKNALVEALPKQDSRTLAEQVVLKAAVLLERHIEWIDSDDQLATIELDEDSCSMLGMFKHDVEVMNRVRKNG